MTWNLERWADVSPAHANYFSVPRSSCTRTTAGLKLGVHCEQTTQVIVDEQHSVSCKQYEALTLQPASARINEVPALSYGERAGKLLFWMLLPAPDTNLVANVRGVV